MQLGGSKREEKKTIEDRIGKKQKRTKERVLDAEMTLDNRKKEKILINVIK